MRVCSPSPFLFPERGDSNGRRSSGEDRSTIPLDSRELGFTSRAGFVSYSRIDPSRKLLPPPTLDINCERINAPFAIPDEDDDSLFHASVCFHPRVVIGSRTRFRDEREREKSISGGRGIIPTDSPRVAMVVRSGGCTIIPGILSLGRRNLVASSIF